MTFEYDLDGATCQDKLGAYCIEVYFFQLEQQLIIP